MNTFNESFYTTDFDHNMMDFIEEVVYGVEDYEREWNALHTVLVYSDTLNGFWTEATNSPEEDYSEAGYTLLTKQQFKERIGMPVDNSNKEETFTKKDLVDGMFVKTRDNNLYLKLGNSCYSLKAYLELSEYTEDLMDIDEECDFDIMEVFTKHYDCHLGLSHILGQGLGITSIWKRTPPKSERQIILEENVKRYEDELRKLQQNLATVKQQLEEELSL